MNTFTEEALASSKQDILLLMRKAVNKRKKIEKKASKGDEVGSPSDTPTSQKSGTRGEPSTRSSLSLERLLAKVESSIEETSKQSQRVVLRTESNGSEKARNGTNRHADETPAERAQRLLRMADVVEQSNIRKKQMMQDPDDMSVFSSADTILSNFDGPNKPRSALEMGLARVDAQEGDDSDEYSGEEEEDDDDDENDHEDDDDKEDPRTSGTSNRSPLNSRNEEPENKEGSEHSNETENDADDKVNELSCAAEKPVVTATTTPPSASITSSTELSSTSNDPLVVQLRRQLLEARTAFVTMQQNAVLRCEKLEMEHNETNASLGRAEAKLKAANDRIIQLESERVEHEKLKMEYAVLNGEIASTKRDLESSQQNIMKLEEDKQALVQVKKKYERACSQLESMNKELDATRARLKKLEDEHENYEKLNGLSEFQQVHLLTEAQVRGAELEQQLTELSKKHRSTVVSHDELRMIIMSSCRKCRLRLPREQYVAKAVERKKNATLASTSEESANLSIISSRDAKAAGSLSQFLESVGLFSRNGDDQSIASRRSEAAGLKSNRPQLDVVMDQIERRMSDDLSSLKKSWLTPLKLNGSSTRKSTESEASANAELKKKVEEGLAGSTRPKKKKSISHSIPTSPRSGKSRAQKHEAMSRLEEDSGCDRFPPFETDEMQSIQKRSKSLGDVLDSAAPDRPSESRDAMSLASSIVLAKRRLSSSHKSEADDIDVEKQMLEILVSDGA